MLWQDWIKAEANPRWGEIDPASQLIIDQWFADREVFDDDKMSSAFWNRCAIYGPAYRDMLRIQAANQTMDPLVTRYLEALRIDSATNGSERKETGSRTRNGQQQQQVIHSAPDTLERDIRDSYGAQSGSDTLTYDGRVRESVRSGKESSRTHGDGRNNYSKDGDGSRDETQHKLSTRSSTSRSGKLVVKDERLEASKGTQASKQAPMTAVNLERNAAAGADADAYETVKGGALGPQSWKAAAAYQESGGESGVSSRREEGYEGDNTVIQRDGESADNVDVTIYGRVQETGTDLTTETVYDQLSDTVKDLGSEKRSHQEAAREDIHKTKEVHTVSPVTQSGTESGLETNTGSVQESGTSSGESWNRYTGREGLSPQEGFKQALEYLQSYPNCIKWLIAQLEPCFIGVMEV